MTDNTIVLWACAALLLAATPSTAQNAPPPAAPLPAERHMERFTGQDLNDLVLAARRNGKDAWLSSEIAAFVAIEDEGETAAGRQLSVATHQGDKIAFVEPLDAVGVYIFARRTTANVLYVFRVDSNLKLITAVRRFPRGRLTPIKVADAQRHLDITLDEWVQVLDMARKGHKL